MDRVRDQPRSFASAMGRMAERSARKRVTYHVKDGMRAKPAQRADMPIA